MWVELIVGHPVGVAETCLLVWETNPCVWWPQKSEVKCSVWKKRSHLRAKPAGPPDTIPISTWETYCSSQLCRCGKGSIKRFIHSKPNTFRRRNWIWVSKAVFLTLCQADLFFFFFYHTTQHVGPYFPDQISDPHPQHWKHSCCCFLIQQGFIKFFWHGHTCYIYYLAVLDLPCHTWTFSSCGERELLSSCSIWASPCSGFSCCGAPALESSGFSGWGTQV